MPEVTPVKAGYYPQENEGEKMREITIFFFHRVYIPGGLI